MYSTVPFILGHYKKGEFANQPFIIDGELIYARKLIQPVIFYRFSQHFSRLKPDNLLQPGKIYRLTEPGKIARLDNFTGVD